MSISPRPSCLPGGRNSKALSANRCRLIKDVDGVNGCDPAIGGDARPRRYVALNDADALAGAAPLVQPKAVRFLERNGAHVEIAGLLSPCESTIGRFNAKLVEPRRMPPTSVLLLGLGTVGLGVCQRIMAMPDRFRLAGLLVRDRAKHTANGIPTDVLYDSADHFVSVQAVHADVVVDAMPGLEPSHALVRQFLTVASASCPPTKRSFRNIRN